VDAELTVDAPDADRGDRTVERDIRDGQRRRRAAQRDHVGVAVLLGREDGRDDLGLVAPALRDQRPDRSVDETRGEDLLLGGLSFALEKAAGDLPGGERLLLVVDGEGQEIDSLTRGRCGRGRDQDDRVAVADEGRAACLPRHLPDLDREWSTGQLQRY